MAKRRSSVLSIITLISITGVALGVTALIVVLSVMGGFKKDLMEKILGTKAHIVIKAADDDPLLRPAEIAEQTRKHSKIVGASPYVEAEVMVSSPTNLSGVILRGIDPDHIGQVSTLARDMQEGKLEYLRDPSPLDAELAKKRDMEMDLLLDRLERERKELEQETGEDDSTPDEQGEPAEVPEHLEEAAKTPLDAPDEADEPDEGGMPPLPHQADDSDEGSMPPLPHQIEEEEGGMPPLPHEETGGEEGGMPPLPGADDADDGDAEDEERLPGLVIGPELAKSLQVDLGDEVNVVTPNAEMGPMGPIPRSRPFEIVGIFYSGMYEYDANFAYTWIEDSRDFLNVEGATGIELKTVSVREAELVAADLQNELGSEVDVLDWKELNKSLFYALELEKIAMFVVLTFIILVASFSIIAMLIMIVIEKGREIAILKSMGATNGGIMRTFVFQGLVIGTLGAIIGLLLGLGICWFLATVGFPLNSEVYYINTLPVDVNPVEVALVVVCAIVISLLATVYPSIQAARLNPVDGLRYD
jgi:lipoprotein-releasing system permease protein